MRYIETVVTSPVPGREDEFNRWYEDTHLPEVLQVPGIVAARRYALTGLQVPGFVAGRRSALTGPSAAERPRFLAVYEIETEDLAATLETLGAAAPTMTASDAVDNQATVIDIYEVLGERRTARDSADGARKSKKIPSHPELPYPTGSDRGEK